MKGNDFMKKMRRMMSIILISVITFCICSFSVSAEAYTITVQNANTAVSIDGNEYTAYKIFSVTYDNVEEAYTYNTDATCLDLTYSGYDPSLNTLNKLFEHLGTEVNARAFGDYVYSNIIKGNEAAITADKASATASGETASISVPSAGYYLVFGTANNENGAAGFDSVTSLVMLNTASPSVTVNTKLDAPSLSKQIQHNDDNSWGTVGDNQIGDTVNFRLQSKVPNINGYSAYTYKIYDTMTTGLGFNNGSVVVKVNDSATLANTYYTVTATAGGQTLEVSVKIKEAIAAGVISANDTLYTYYSATLNTAAAVAPSAVDTTNHNDNTAYLEYSNDPYNTSSTGKTPDVKVYDWTYEFTVNKVNKNNTPLADAGFTVTQDGNTIKFTKKDNAKEEYTVDPSGTITEIKTNATGTFKIIGLDDTKTYIITETTVPSGYSQCDPVDVTLSSTYNSAGNELSTLTATVNGGKTASGLSVTIENLSGSKLVGTGGIGTKIFYVSGGILMLGAAILLITGKRMKNKEM
jgi:fimbrial isopeptide formation D2 family protein